MLKKGLQSYRDNLQRSTRNSKLFLTACFFIFLSLGGIRVILNLYLQTLGFSEQFIGSLSSIRFITAGAVAIPAAIYASRIGFKKALLTAALLISTALAGMALSTMKPFLIFFNILWGAANMVLGVIAAPFLVVNSSPQERPHLFSINFALRMITGMAGNFAGGFLVARLKLSLAAVPAYQFTILSFALLSIIGLIPLFLIQNQAATERDGFGKLITRFKDLVTANHNVQRLVIYSIFIGIGAGMIVPLFNIFLHNKLGAGDAHIGTIMALSQVATALGALLTPFIITILGRIKTVVLPQVLSIPFLLLIGLAGNIYIVGTAYLFRMALMNMVNPVTSNFAMEIVPEGDRANTNSVLRSIRRIGRGIGSFFSGIMLGEQIYLLPFIITAILYVSASSVFFLSFNKHDSSPHAGQSA
ncbi:MAG: MFS transporter [Halanaerobium sp.]|nr:MFS transporter [Halanaerobium sp.]